jgi:hypothetical protein
LDDFVDVGHDAVEYGGEVAVPGRGSPLSH